MTFWICGNAYAAKLPAKVINKISLLLKQLSKTQPVDFARKIRCFDTIKFWKETEFCTFLLYIGPIVLRDILPNAAYKHFISLHCAISIYASDMHYKYHHIAKKLLLYFVDSYKIIYGYDTISYNVHNLVHIPDDIENFGLIDSFSAFPYEIQLYKIKNLLRSGNKPLQQAAKRLIECSKLDNLISNGLQDTYPQACRKKCSTSTSAETDYTFDKIQFQNFFLDTSERNKFFMSKNNDIVEMQCATYNKNKLIINGRRVTSKSNVYDTPINSSHLCIYIGHDIENISKIWKVSDVKCKLFYANVNNQKYFFPILHSNML